MQMFSHFNLIGPYSYVKTKLSCPVFVAVTVADELSLFKPRNSGLAVRNKLLIDAKSKIF